NLGCGLRSFRDDPFDFSGADFILGDPAGLAGIGLNDRWSAPLQLARTPRGHQDVAVITVEAFDQLHTLLPQNDVRLFALDTAGVAARVQDRLDAIADVVQAAPLSDGEFVLIAIGRRQTRVSQTLREHDRLQLLD